MKSAAAAVILFLGLASTAAAQGDKLGVKYRWWDAELEGDMSSQEGALGGTSTGLDDTLGIGNETFHDVTIWGALPLVGQAQNPAQGIFEIDSAPGPHRSGQTTGGKGGIEMKISKM